VGGVEAQAYLSPHPYPVLDYEQLGVIQMSYAVTRCDTNQQLWEICKIPRLRKGTDKEMQFREMGTILAHITAANDDLPPLAVGEDFASVFGNIVLAFLGLLEQRYMNTTEFFKDCQYQPLPDIPMFPYKALYYKKQHPVFNSGCGRHCFKSNVEMLRSGIRWIKQFAFWVSLMPGVSGGRVPSIFQIDRPFSACVSRPCGAFWTCAPGTSVPGPSRASHSNIIPNTLILSATSTSQAISKDSKQGLGRPRP